MQKSVNSNELSPLKGKIHRLKSSQSLIFDDPETVWIVRQGSIDLLSTKIRDKVPISLRRHLFQVLSHHAVFGCEPLEENGYLGLMGIASANTEVMEVRVEDFATNLGQDPSRQGFVEDWVRAIGRMIAADQEIPATVSRFSETQEIEFGEQEVFASERGTSAWVNVSSGTVNIFGQTDLVLTPEQGYFLAGPELWFQVTGGDATVSIFPMPGPAGENVLKAGISELHRFFNRSIKHLIEQEEKTEKERRESRRQHDEQKSIEAFASLASVLDPTEGLTRRESHLMTALGVIGQMLGIRICPLPEAEEMSRVKEPVEAIARASRVRSRMVLLSGEWWKVDSGPLLAYLGEQERKPVALLPIHGVYEIVKPERLQHEPLTDQLKDELCPDAFMIYRSMPERISGLFGLFRFAAYRRIGDMIFIMTMGLCATLLGMVAPRASGTIIDSALPLADTRLLYELALILTVAGVAAAGFTLAQVLTTVRTSAISDVAAQSGMWDRLLKFRPAFYRQYSSGDLQTRVSAVSEISRELNGATLRPLLSGVLASLNFVLLWYYSLDLAMIALGVGFLVLVVTLVVSYFIRQLSITLQELAGNFSGLMIQMIGGVAKLRVAAAEYRAFHHWVNKYTEQLRLIVRIQRLQDGVGIFILVLPPLVSALLFWKAVDLIATLPPGHEDRITMGDFVAFNAAFSLFLGGWAELSNTLVGVLNSVVRGRRIKPILDGHPEVPEDAADPGRLTGHICLENVSFRYSEEGSLILDEVSFEAHPGEFIAFVGSSGSGKSTILRILLGFETPEYGRVIYDHHDLAGLDVLAVRRQIGSVLQNGRLNAGSILSNISNNAKITHTEAMDAIADAGMADDIEQMPMGLHTVVAEGGFNLSGGQRQRLLIARALAARPKIVMFDEATSALDNKTQSVVSEALDRRKVTRVVIAHRLSTIRSANRIYVLDAGRIIQSGSYKDLAQQEGQFKELMARQIV